MSTGTKTGEGSDDRTREAIGNAMRLQRTEQQNRIAKLRQDMEQRQQEQKQLQRQKEEAEFDAGQFMLTNGDVATGSQLKEHNDKINGEISRFVLELDQSDLRSVNCGCRWQGGVLPRGLV